jgi:hypothetical protein
MSAVISIGESDIVQQEGEIDSKEASQRRGLLNSRPDLGNRHAGRSLMTKSS